MARYTIGRILPIFQGNWDSTQSYDKLDIVLKGIVSYVSNVDNNTTEPTANNNSWQVVCRGATAEEVVAALEDGQLQVGRLDVANDVTASDVYVSGSIKIGGKDVATQEYVSNAVKYGIDEVAIDQTATDRVRIETTMIGGGGSSSSILSATSTRAGVMTATDKAKLDSLSPQGEHPIDVQSDGNGDLDISDDAGYILGRFENGHIRTKNFYSGNIYTKSEVDSLIETGSLDGVTQQQLNEAMATKQNKLVSGTNIKTINNQSILGSGNLVINSGSTPTPIHLKIGIIGNSYSYDSFMYMPFILQNYGITIEIGIYYRGGGTIQNHIDEWDSNSSERGMAHIDTRNGDTAWTYSSTFNNPHKLVTYTNWDIIVLQQGSTASANVSNYANTRTLIDKITNAYQTQFPNQTFQLAWNININRSSMGNTTTVWNNILNAIKATCDTQAINIIFPYGTAIFDARTNSTLDAIGEGGHLWASDNTHLQQGLPCYLAALANTQTLFNKFYPQYSVYGDTLRPTDALDDTWHIQGQNGNCVGVTEANCRLAQICAIVANRYNFEIKTIS